MSNVNTIGLICSTQALNDRTDCRTVELLNRKQESKHSAFNMKVYFWSLFPFERSQLMLNKFNWCCATCQMNSVNSDLLQKTPAILFHLRTPLLG